MANFEFPRSHIEYWTKRQGSTHPNRHIPISLLLYNISSLRRHFHDLLSYITQSFPTIWALIGLHFNDTANYYLASFFKSSYTIYYQRGSNSFGGVCLPIARELPHRLVSAFSGKENLIVADFFLLNRTYTLALVYSPPSEIVPIEILSQLYAYNQNLILIGDMNARHSSWHDVTDHFKGQTLAMWLDDKTNLQIFTCPQPTSVRSDPIIDLIIAPSHLSNELANVDLTFSVTDHLPVHWVSLVVVSESVHSNTRETNRLESSQVYSSDQTSLLLFSR